MTFPFYKPLQLLLEKAGEKGLIAMLFVCSLAVMASASFWWMHHLSNRLEIVEDHQRTVLIEVLRETNQSLTENTVVLKDVKRLLILQELKAEDALWWYSWEDGRIYVVRFGR